MGRMAEIFPTQPPPCVSLHYDTCCTMWQLFVYMPFLLEVRRGGLVISTMVT